MKTLIDLSTYKPIDRNGLFTSHHSPFTNFTIVGGKTTCVAPYSLNALVPTKKKTAFTLAEVLITLGIIGVVAALTIPSLITNYKAHRLRSQFLKSYSVVQQVFKQMEADDVSLDPVSYARHSGSFYTLFKNYLTGITDCGTWTTKASPCANVYNLNYKTRQSR